MSSVPDFQLSQTQAQFIQLQQKIDRQRIANLVIDHQKGQLNQSDKSYYGDLIDDFVALVKLPNSAHLAMQVLPEFKMTVPVLLDGMAYRALADKDPKAGVFACYMIDQSLLRRDLMPLFDMVIEYGTPELWVELVKKVNNAPADKIVAKVYASSPEVQAYWEEQILNIENTDNL